MLDTAASAVPGNGETRVQIHDIAVALAHEGVPVRAIARSTKVPSDDLYALLTAAIDQGTILELPRDDWPSNSRRAYRSQAERDVLSLPDESLITPVASVFKTTRLQSAVLIHFLRRPELSKAQVHAVIESTRPDNEEPTDMKMVDVVVCHIRKRISPFGMTMNTIWGVGYRLLTESREIGVNLIAKHIGDA